MSIKQLIIGTLWQRGATIDTYHLYPIISLQSLNNHLKIEQILTKTQGKLYLQIHFY